MISIILSVAVVALIAYNVYLANKVQSELIIKNAIIASLQTQVEALFKAKAELIQQLNAATKEVLPKENPAIFSKKKASAKPAKV
jgi:hypothetical protein